MRIWTTTIYEEDMEVFKFICLQFIAIILLFVCGFCIVIISICLFEIFVKYMMYLPSEVSIIFGSIFQKFRDFTSRISPNFWGKLTSCFICLGTWAGFILSLCGLSPMETTHSIHDINVFDLFIIPTKFITVNLLNLLPIKSLKFINLSFP